MAEAFQTNDADYIGTPGLSALQGDGQIAATGLSASSSIAPSAKRESTLKTTLAVMKARSRTYAKIPLRLEGAAKESNPPG